MDRKEDLIRYYRWLRKYGLNDSHSGNASLRMGEKVWITPTGACADTLNPGLLILCTLDAPPPPAASLDAPLHLAVYRENPKAKAVLHSHSPYAIAMTLEGGDFIPVDFEGRYYFERVPVLDIPFEAYLEEAPRKVAETLARHPICMVQGHGAYAWGEDLDRAYKWSCSLHASAKIAWLAR